MANKTFRIKYSKASDFKTTLATGVFGGLSNNGLLNANFFTDRAILPKYQNIEIDDEGNQIGKPVDEKDGDMLREVQVGVVMDINTAKSIVAWMNSKIEEFEKNIKK
jgi:hypothetical protein